MKNTVTTSEIFKYILLFTFLFAAFLALAITYNRVFKLKNETISIIEEYEGVSNISLNIINNYLNNNGYSTKGQCELNEYGIKNLDSMDPELVTNTNEKYMYCLKYYCDPDSQCRVGGESNPNAPNNNYIYYNVKLFFKFNLPFIGELFTFKISGETKGIKYYSVNQRLS